MGKIISRNKNIETQEDILIFEIDDVPYKITFNLKAKDLTLYIREVMNLDLDKIFQRKGLKDDLYKTFEWIDLIRIHFSNSIKINDETLFIKDVIDYLVSNYKDDIPNNLEIILGEKYTLNHHLDIIDIVSNDISSIILK